MRHLLVIDVFRVRYFMLEEAGQTTNAKTAPRCDSDGHLVTADLRTASRTDGRSHDSDLKRRSAARLDPHCAKTTHEKPLQAAGVAA